MTPAQIAGGCVVLIAYGTVWRLTQFVLWTMNRKQR